MNFNNHLYQLEAERQRRALESETRREIRLREQLAHDPIVALMRGLRCDLCGCPVVSCECDGSELPFAYEDEVTE